MYRTLTLMLALSVTTACSDTVTEDPGAAWCLEECLSAEAEPGDSESTPPSTEAEPAPTPPTDPPSTDPPSSDPPAKQPPSTDPPAEPEPQTPPTESALTGTFVSGHLGYYDGCPERAYSGDGSAGGDGDGVWCDDASCLPCEPATVVIRLQNVSDVPIRGVHVSLIELYGADDGILRAELPHESTRDVQTAELFDGTVGAGSEVMLRIEFAGPLEPWVLLGPVGEGDGISNSDAQYAGGIVETTFSSDDHADVVVESPPIHPVPQIDT